MAKAMVLALAIATLGSCVAADSIYNYNFTDINGVPQTMGKYKDYPIIIVNVASACGKTETVYAMLQKMYDDYKAKGLRILGFPCNQWAEEPGTEEVIKTFAQKLGITFDLTSKVDVNGPSAHSLWKCIKIACPSGVVATNEVDWNFNMFLFDKTGSCVKRFSTASAPGELQTAVEKQFA